MAFFKPIDWKNINYKEMGIELLWEIGASALIAAGVYNFALNAKFPMTGFTGIAMILYRLFGLPIGLTTIALNIPLAFLCYKLIGRRFLISSLRCMVISSLFIDYLAPLFPVYNGDRMLAALATGVLSGLGYAFIYMRQASTGGSDFVIMAVRALRPHMKLSTLAFINEVLIILAGGIIFKDIDGILYGMVINYLLAAMIDRVMLGVNEGKVGFVVTTDGKSVCKAIDDCAGRGSTILPAQGGYRQEGKDVVMVACSSREMYAIEKAVKQVDEKSFMIVMNSTEVHGEGFRVIR